MFAGVLPKAIRGFRLLEFSARRGNLKGQSEGHLPAPIWVLHFTFSLRVNIGIDGQQRSRWGPDQDLTASDLPLSVDSFNLGKARSMTVLRIHSVVSNDVLQYEQARASVSAVSEEFFKNVIVSVIHWIK
jgi:hypothetical protein